ncbi:MAG: type II secretion system protein [Patescibacteria group bacterium]|nr:type II secretion system protein [Patescibacteria group bacterium]
MKENSAQAGFTLIEVLVVAILLGVFAAIATDTFSNIMKAQNKVRITNELEQSGNYALSKMEQDIRNAESLICCESGFGEQCQVGSMNKSIKLIVDGVPVLYLIEDVGGGVYALGKRVGDSEPTSHLTDTDPSSGVSINRGNTSFVCASDGKRVSVTLALEPGPQAPLRSEFQGTVQLQTSAVLRGISY